jgi:hypothetical protein
MQRKLLIFLGFAALTATGFFREYLFLNINEQIRVTYYQVNDTHVDPPLKVLAQFSYGELYYVKWLIHAFFPKLEGSYAISRFLVGMTETPLLSVLLVAAFTLVNKQEYIRDTNKS